MVSDKDITDTMDFTHQHSGRFGYNWDRETVNESILQKIQVGFLWYVVRKRGLENLWISDKVDNILGRGKRRIKYLDSVSAMYSTDTALRTAEVHTRYASTGWTKTRTIFNVWNFCLWRHRNALHKLKCSVIYLKQDWCSECYQIYI